MENILIYLLLLIFTLLFCYKLEIKLYYKILVGLFFYISIYILIVYLGYLLFKLKYTITDNFGYGIFSNFLSFVNIHFEFIVSSIFTLLSILLFKKISKEFIVGIFLIVLFVATALTGKIILSAISLECMNHILANILLFTSNIFIIILFAFSIVIIQYIRNNKASKNN